MKYGMSPWLSVASSKGPKRLLDAAKLQVAINSSLASFQESYYRVVEELVVDSFSAGCGVCGAFDS